jgi:rare lipoprotein A
MVILCFRLLYMTLAWSVAAAAPIQPLPVVENPARSVRVSWYGPAYHGRVTASGEVFDMHELTAAHPDLPFGTRLQVICPENGTRVLVRINDRGPFTAGRDLDLSLAAARHLGIERQGLATVYCERLAD